MHILVTGAAGFIGSNLVKRLEAAGHETVAVDNFSSGNWGNLVDYRGDVMTLDVAGDVRALEKLEPFEVVFHQASITDASLMDQRLMMHNNVEGFRQILDLATRWRSRVVFASSASVYGQGPMPMSESQRPVPLNVHAYSKLAMEALAQRYQWKLKMPIVGLRYFSVYGPGESSKGAAASIISQLARDMRGGKPPRILADGEQKRDFVYIEDVLQANVKAMAAKAAGVFNIGSGRAVSFNQVVEELNVALKTDLPAEYFDAPSDLFHSSTADLTEARKALGYEPVYDLAKGIGAYAKSGQLGT